MEPITKYDVTEVKLDQKHYISKRAMIALEELPGFFAESYRGIYDFIQKNGLQPKGMPCAIYYSIDEHKKAADLAAAVPIEGPALVANTFEHIIMPSSIAVTTTHFGSYENMHPAYSVLEKYVSDHGLKRELIIEEYCSDPEKDIDPSRWKTNIYIVVKLNNQELINE